jgi:hypothetical protein
VGITEITQGTATIDAVVRVSVPSTDTGALQARDGYFYRLWRTGSGAEHALAYGDVTLLGKGSF